MKSGKSTRKYYSAGPDGKVASPQRGYLLRWYCEENRRVIAEGPFDNHEKATAAQNARLRMGVCSWLVKYDD